MTEHKVGKVVLDGRRNSYGEFVVKVYDTEGKRWEEADYYTDDKQDALSTYHAMVETAGL